MTTMEEFNQREVENEKKKELFNAIRFGQAEKAQIILKEYPYMLHAKIFGQHERTCLYVAVFLGKLNVVETLVAMGADKTVECNGSSVMDVIGYGATCNPKKVMHIRALLSGRSSIG